jgi:hypothetical protein
MAHVSVSEAARLTGQSRTPLYRAIKSGAMSTLKNDLGQTVIDTSELFRLFPPLHSNEGRYNGEHVESTSESNSKQAENRAETAEFLALERENTLLRERITDKDGVIKDLRERLDQEGEERRKAQTQLTALLTDQRQKPLPAEPVSPRRGWWGLVAVLAMVAGAAGGAWWVLTHPQLLP